jgi:hypothetical protein
MRILQPVIVNETQATGIPMNRDELELAGRNEAQIS